MKKKTLAVLMTAALTVSCLAACGKSSDGSEGGDDKKDADSGEITLQVFDAHAYGLDEYAEMAKKFEESHPGVKIEVQQIGRAHV